MKLVEEEDVRGQKGERYIEYKIAIRPFIVCIRKELDIYGKAVIDYDVLTTKMENYSDKKFTKKDYYTIQLGLQYVLKNYGLDIRRKRNKGLKAFIISYTEDQDALFNGLDYDVDNREKVQVQDTLLFYRD